MTANGINILLKSSMMSVPQAVALAGVAGSAEAVVSRVPMAVAVVAIRLRPTTIPLLRPRIVIRASRTWAMR